MATSKVPHWPAGTVAILSTAGDRPHAIPVSAVVRASPERLLLGLAHRRESLARLRADPRVSVTLLARGCAISVDGHAEVVAERLTENVAAAAVRIEAVHDHMRPTFVIEAGTAWHWTDADAADGDRTVRAALERLAGD